MLLLVGVRATTTRYSSGGSPILPNTNTVSEYLFAPLRCLFAPLRLLFVCSALRGGADAMRKEGHLRPGYPQNPASPRLAEVLRKLWGILIGPYPRAGHAAMLGSK
jgi:hypothetical protein